MRDLNNDMADIVRAMRAERLARNAKARRNARLALVAQCASDGAALVATGALVWAFMLLLSAMTGNGDACALGDLRWLACG